MLSSMIGHIAELDVRMTNCYLHVNVSIYTSFSEKNHMLLMLGHIPSILSNQSFPIEQ